MDPISPAIYNFLYESTHCELQFQPKYNPPEYNPPLRVTRLATMYDVDSSSILKLHRRSVSIKSSNLPGLSERKVSYHHVCVLQGRGYRNVKLSER